MKPAKPPPPFLPPPFLPRAGTASAAARPGPQPAGVVAPPVFRPQGRGAPGAATATTLQTRRAAGGLAAPPLPQVGIGAGRQALAPGAQFGPARAAPAAALPPRAALQLRAALPPPAAAAILQMSRAGRGGKGGKGGNGGKERKESKEVKEAKAPTPKRKRGNLTLGEQAVFQPVSNFSSSGYFPSGTQLQKRPQRKYSRSSAERVEQVLGQISIQTYFLVKKQEPPTEVECMYAGNSLFMSANSNAATQTLYNVLLLTTPEMLRRAMSAVYGRGKDALATKRVGDKLGALYEGSRDIPEALKVLKNLGVEVGFIDLDGADADFWCSAALHVGGMTWIVFGEDLRHAEVKLAKVLERAQWKAGATIQGKKRPCYTCAAYMRLRNKQGYQLHFSDNPGKFWNDEYERSELDVKAEVRKNLQDGVNSHVSSAGDQYRSDSEDEDGAPVKTPRQPARKKRK